jgi:K+-sensing histidine kinase KdpD
MIQDCCNQIGETVNHQISIEGDLDITITADELLIEQVVINFVNNAVKYAPGSNGNCCSHKRD